MAWNKKQQIEVNEDINLDGNILVVENLKKKYGHKEVLKGINLKIKHGEKVGLIGANGAGKTTLSEIIIGVKEKTSGSVKFSFGTSKIAKAKNLGIQFQDSKYPEFFRVKDVISFFVDASVTPIDKKEVDEFIDVFKMRELMKNSVNSLSGGQQQRLNILLGVLHKPKLLILDEVSTGLDVETRAEIQGYIKEYLKKNKTTLILVSHNVQELDELTDRLIILNDGKIFDDVKVLDKRKEYKTLSNYVNHLFEEFGKDKDHEKHPSKSEDNKTTFDKDDPVEVKAYKRIVNNKNLKNLAKK